MMRNKTKILYWINFLTFRIGLFFVGFFKRANLADTLLLIPPTDEGSFGDEAMIVAVLSNLPKDKFSKVIVLNGKIKSWRNKLDAYGIHVSFEVCWGNFQRPGTVLRFIKLLRLYKPKAVYEIGADVMDGYYSQNRSLMRTYLLRLSTAVSNDVRLLGFSFNKQPNTLCVDSLRELSEKASLYARDPISAKRLTDRGVNCFSVADLAFMLSPRTVRNHSEVDSTIDFINRESKLDRKTICVNINAIHNKQDGYLSSLYGLLNYILNNGFSIVFVSHDDRDFGGFTDYSLAKDFIQLNDNKQHTYLVKEDMDAAELKYIAGQSCFILTGRMHFAIGALSQAVPALMFGYQGKQEGLAKLVGLQSEEVVIEPDSSADDMIGKFVEFDLNTEKYEDLISSHIDSVKQLSRKNLE